MIFAGETVDHVVAIVAPQGIPVSGADEVLDAVELVAGGIAAPRGVVLQPDADTLRRPLVGHRVDADAAVDLVAAAAAVDEVVAFVAPQQVGLIVAVELVVIFRAGQVLDTEERIALGVAAQFPLPTRWKGLSETCTPSSEP